MDPSPLAPSRHPKSRRARVLSTALFGSWLAATALQPAAAATFDMPAGGTSWIEVSANACDLGTPALGGDCFGASRLLPTREYSLEPPASIVAGGEVFSDRIRLSNTAGQNSGGGFAWGATGGLFTLHGSGAAPVTVTATLKLDGQISKTQVLRFGSLSASIGTWSFGEVASDLNQRVNPIVSNSFSCTFNTCAGRAIDELLTMTLSVLPGQTFNLGFQLTTSTLSLGPTLSAVTASGQAVFSLDAGAGYHFTGSNGYDSRSPVPEPGSWALMLVGLGLLGRVSRHRS
ncbi:MAG: PEPxxWA-CTERM sorting domain-containing protein [Rubrivivax sp.]|nr:PEPxxWA-CTERM sorting domain-containing protein [Rubrivivax sp.]